MSIRSGFHEDTFFDNTIYKPDDVKHKCNQPKSLREQVKEIEMVFNFFLHRSKIVVTVILS